MSIPKARKEYCQYIYNRIISKLKEANEYELLSFAILGLDHNLRPKDILNIKWDQVDFKNKYIDEITLHKNNLITDIDMTTNSYVILNEWYKKTDDKVNIFPSLKRFGNSEKIGELIGDIDFNSHKLRQIGIVVKLISMEDK